MNQPVLGSPLRAAIIGISGHARLHLYIALEQMFHRRVRLLAAVVVNVEEEAILSAWLERLGCRIFESVEALWAEYAGKIDLCFIPTGIHLHAEMTVRALAAGANVLVEKPLAATLEQADAIARAEVESGLRVFVAYQDMYAASTHAIKELLCSGSLGALRRVAVTGLWPRGAHYYQRNRWAGRIKVEGRWVFDSPLNNAFAHYLNLALFWSGTTLLDGASPAAVEGELYRARAIESFDTAAVRVTTADGVKIGMFVSHSCATAREPCIRIECDAGQVVWTKGECYEVIRPGRPPQRSPLAKGPDSIFTMGEVLVEALRGARTPQGCGVAVARAHTAVIAALHQSCAIRDVPTRFLSAAGDYIAIADIDRVICEAGSTLQLFSELAVPWAAPGGSCQVADVELKPPVPLPPPT